MDKPSQHVNTVHGLIKRRRDLQSQADHLSTTLTAINLDIVTLDNAIRLMDPLFDVSTIKPKQYHMHHQNLKAYQQIVIQVMSSDGGWFTPQEIALQCEKDYAKMTQSEKAKYRNRIRNFLSRQVDRGWMKYEDGKFQIDQTIRRLDRSN